MTARQHAVGDELDQRIRSLEAERLRPVPPPPPLIHSTCGQIPGGQAPAEVDSRQRRRGRHS